MTGQEEYPRFISNRPCGNDKYEGKSQEQEANSDNARKELFKDMNSGRIRFLFGSTQKLGTGVNAQERAVAIHHLDIP